MRNFLMVIGAIVFLSTGCKSTSLVYERDDLVTIAHNKGSDYTLLVYQSARGRMRKVLRRKGVCELLLIEMENGEFYLKERGHEAKKVNELTMMIVQAHLDELIYGNKAPAAQVNPEGSF